MEYKEDLSNSLMAQAISSKEVRLVLLQQYSQPPPRSAVVAPLPFMVKRIGQGEWCKKVIYAMSVVLKQRGERERESAQCHRVSKFGWARSPLQRHQPPPKQCHVITPLIYATIFVFWSRPKRVGPTWLDLDGARKGLRRSGMITFPARKSNGSRGKGDRNPPSTHNKGGRRNKSNKNEELTIIIIIIIIIIKVRKKRGRQSGRMLIPSPKA